MDAKIPRDIEGYPLFPRLMRSIGNRADAVFVVHRLWTALCYQVDIHGQAGLFEGNEMPEFCQSIVDALAPSKVLTPGGVLASLTSSRLLQPRGDDYFCTLFFSLNPNLDLKEMVQVRSKIYGKVWSAVKRRTGKIIPNLHASLWEKGNGTKFTDAEMNESVLLIKTLDRILHIPERSPKEFDVPLIQSAYQITREFGQARLTAILRRFFQCRALPGVPRTTPLMLNGWDKALAIITPEDGWGLWIKKEGADVIPI
jgi:hypothetical protein